MSEFDDLQGLDDHSKFKIKGVKPHLKWVAPVLGLIVAAGLG